MTQTFIDMLVAIKDPAAIEKAYNILAAKRELLAAERNTVKTREFAHTFMEPKPIGEELIRLKDCTTQMRRNGFHEGMVFRLKKAGSTNSVLTHVRTGKLAIINNSYLESFRRVVRKLPA